MKCGIEEEFLPAPNPKFEVKIEINDQKVYKSLDKSLSAYKDEKRGATILLLQSNIDEAELKKSVPSIDDFPIIKINVQEKYENVFSFFEAWHLVLLKKVKFNFFKLNIVEIR